MKASTQEVGWKGSEALPWAMRNFYVLHGHRVRMPCFVTCWPFLDQEILVPLYFILLWLSSWNESNLRPGHLGHQRSAGKSSLLLSSSPGRTVVRIMNSGARLTGFGCLMPTSALCSSVSLSMKWVWIKWVDTGKGHCTLLLAHGVD